MPQTSVFVILFLLFWFSRNLADFFMPNLQMSITNFPSALPPQGEYRFPTDDLIIGAQPAGRLSWRGRYCVPGSLGISVETTGTPCSLHPLLLLYIFYVVIFIFIEVFLFCSASLSRSLIGSVLRLVCLISLISFACPLMWPCPICFLTGLSKRCWFMDIGYVVIFIEVFLFCSA